jgi:hypothetical protein
MVSIFFILSQIYYEALSMFFQTASLTRNRLLLVAPVGASFESFDGEITPSDRLHSDMIAQAQRLRGGIYLEDGAIDAAQLTSDGRHVSDLDYESWHLLITTPAGRMVGCARFRQHANTVCTRELGVSQVPLASSKHWGERFHECLDRELDRARSIGFSYVEFGGWALHKDVRGTAEALNSALASFAWSQIQGGAIGISAATQRNGSASILRRLGGKSLESEGAPLPPYYDQNYKCMMEVLRFDSRMPNPKYMSMIQNLASHLSTLPIICPRAIVGHTIRNKRTPFVMNGFIQPQGLEAAA